MANNAIEIRNLTKWFGEIHAIDGIDLTVNKGEMFGLIGHNGSGKSTLFKLMLGLIPVSTGEIRVQDTLIGGRDFRKCGAASATCLRISSHMTISPGWKYCSCLPT